MKAIVLLSGGIDSATALYWCKKRGWTIYALTFDYEREQSVDLKAAASLARTAGVKKHIVVDVDFYKKLRGSPSASKDKIIDANSGISGAYVPARNIVFLGIAAAYAETTGSKVIVTGHNREDRDRFPDASKKFFETFNKIFKLGLKSSRSQVVLKVLTPLGNLTKLQVLSKAIELDVPLKATWSCYNNGAEPCGVCYGCKSREHAFLALGIKDPQTG